MAQRNQPRRGVCRLKWWRRRRRLFASANVVGPNKQGKCYSPVPLTGTTLSSVRHHMPQSAMMAGWYRRYVAWCRWWSTRSRSSLRLTPPRGVLLVGTNESNTGRPRTHVSAAVQQHREYPTMLVFVVNVITRHWHKTGNTADHRDVRRDCVFAVVWRLCATRPRTHANVTHSFSCRVRHANVIRLRHCRLLKAVSEVCGCRKLLCVLKQRTKKKLWQSVFNSCAQQDMRARSAALLRPAVAGRVAGSASRASSVSRSDCTCKYNKIAGYRLIGG